MYRCNEHCGMRRIEENQPPLTSLKILLIIWLPLFNVSEDFLFFQKNSKTSEERLSEEMLNFQKKEFQKKEIQKNSFETFECFRRTPASQY